MKFTATQDFTSLAELQRFYSDADEIVYKNHCELDEQAIAALCRDARRLAARLHAHHGTQDAGAIAQSYGIAVVRNAWQTAEGKLVYLAECTLQPPQISLNIETIAALAELMAQWAPESEQRWFSEKMLAEVATAHELFHLLEPHAARATVELAAHCFARAFTALPFSPLLYHVLLARLVRGKGAQA
jgi:hypothetical protein